MTYDTMASLTTNDNWRDKLRDNPEEFIVDKIFSLFTFLSAIFIIIVVIASVIDDISIRHIVQTHPSRFPANPSS